MSLQNRWVGESSPAGSIPVRLRLTKAPSDQRRCPEPGEIWSRKGVRPEPERPRPPHKSLVVPSARRRTSLPTTCRSTGQVRFDPGPVTSHRASMRDGKPVPDVTGGARGGSGDRQRAPSRMKMTRRLSRPSLARSLILSGRDRDCRPEAVRQVPGCARRSRPASRKTLRIRPA
jgi:hypothetical protein